MVTLVTPRWWRWTHHMVVTLVTWWWRWTRYMMVALVKLHDDDVGHTIWWWRWSNYMMVTLFIIHGGDIGHTTWWWRCSYYMVVTLVTLYDDDVRHMLVSHKIRIKFGCVVPAFPLDLQHSQLWVGAGRTKSHMAVGLQGLMCFTVVVLHLLRGTKEYFGENCCYDKGISDWMLFVFLSGNWIIEIWSFVQLLFFVALVCVCVCVCVCARARACMCSSFVVIHST